MKSSKKSLYRAGGKLEAWMATVCVIASVAVAILQNCGVIHRGDPLVLGLYLLAFAPLLLARIYVFERLGEPAQQSWDAGVDQALPIIIAKKTTTKIREIHARTFPLALGIHERGATGRNIASSTTTPCAAGRQSGASVARRRASGGKSADDDGDGGDGDGDGEPPHRHYSYASAAHLLDCSQKTLRNKVSAGLIPPPILTAVGPRFSPAQIAALLHPPVTPTAPAPAPKRRGRPRIAAVMSGKGAMS
jgi:hypothetical protein